jgi:type IV secretory pathway VirD2 relaxase
MRRPKLLNGDREAGLRLPRLKPGQARGPRRLVPWWARMLRRVEAARRVHHQSKRGAGSAEHSVRQAPHLYGRRSVVKASFRRNRHNRGWTAHARYLAREHAQREQEHGIGFDANREDLDLTATVREWERADDQLMWSFIISPEDAARMDLREHVRELVAAMEADFDTRLEWVAIDHHNTDDAHVHLLIRGVREDGRPLEIDREYLKHGIRDLSERLIERELGPRSEREVLLARERVVEREQWTEIDRALRRQARADRVVSFEEFQPRSEAARVRAEQEMKRLEYLESFGLARRIGERSWELSPEHEPELRRRQREHDIIKTRARERQREQGFERERERDG